mgnify:CR=1 FL=1
MVDHFLIRGKRHCCQIEEGDQIVVNGPTVSVVVRIDMPEDKFTEKIQETGSLAEKYCLVSRSVTCPVNYQLEIEFKEK